MLLLSLICLVLSLEVVPPASGEDDNPGKALLKLLEKLTDDVKELKNNATPAQPSGESPTGQTEEPEPEPERKPDRRNWFERLFFSE